MKNNEKGALKLGIWGLFGILFLGFGISPAGAQAPSLTTVKDTVYMGGAAPGSGNPLASGTVVVSWQPFLDAANKAVLGGTRTYTLMNGALAVSLVPNAGGTPSGTAYTVRYYQTGVAFREEFWVVPASSPLANPAQVVSVTQQGTPGTTTYYYWCSATNATGETLLSPSRITTTSNATLSGTNYNVITCATVSGATGYKAYRTTTAMVPSGTGNYLVGSAAGTIINDQSNTLNSTTIPTVNDTDSKTLQQVRVTLPPSPSAVFAASQVTGTAIVANPTATQTIIAPATSGVPLKVKGRSGNTSNVFEAYDNAGTPGLQFWVEDGGETCAKRFVALVRDARCFSGSDMDAKVIAAIADLPSTGGTVNARGLEGAQTLDADICTGIGTKPVTILLGSATITVSATQTCNTEKISIIGLGPSQTRLTCTVNADCLRLRTSAFNTNKAGIFGGFQMAGNSGANAVAIHIGDIIGTRLENIWITDFTGTSSTGIWFDNVTNFTEQTLVENVRVQNATKALRFTVNGGTSSFSYQTFSRVSLEIQNSQTAISSENNALLAGSSFDITINKSGAASGTILALADTSTWTNNSYHIVAENTGGGAGTGMSIAAGASLSGSGKIVAAGLTNSISGTLETLLPHLSSTVGTSVVETPLTLSARLASPVIGSYLFPLFSTAGFRMGLGMNLRFDGTNWVTKNDGGNNGATAILGSYGTSAIEFFVVPSTGASDQSISNATLDSTHKRATLSSAGLTLAANVTSPQFTSTASDAADAGVVRLGNDEAIAAEASPAGTDGTLKYNSSEQWDMNSPLTVTGGITASKALMSHLEAVTFSATPTFDASLGNSFKMTLTANVTSSTISNPQTGQFITLLLCQDGTGSRTMSWPSNLKLAGGAYTLTTTINKCDSVTAVYDGSNWYETARASNL